MRKILKMSIIVCVILLFSITCAADDTADGLISDFEEIVPEEYRGITDDGASEVGIDMLISEIASALSGEAGRLGSFFLLMLGSLALMSVARTSAYPIFSSVQSAVSVICTLAIGERLTLVFADMSENLGALNSFFSSLIPVFSAVNLASGALSGAGAQAAGMNLVLSIVSGFATAFVSGVVGFGFAMGIISVIGEDGAMKISRGVKSFFMWILGLGTAVLMGMLSLQTLISSSGDNAAMRAARYMTTGLVPVVGSTISASLSTLASGISYAKGIIGAGAIFIILLIFLSPLCVVLLYRLILSVFLTLSEFLGTSAAARSYGAFRSSLDTLIAVYSLSAIVYIFEIILFVKSGVPLL